MENTRVVPAGIRDAFTPAVSGAGAVACPISPSAVLDGFVTWICQQLSGGCALTATEVPEAATVPVA